MSLDRPDLKFRLDPAYHRALKRVCDAKGIGMNEWLEELVVGRLRELVHEASVIAESAAELGISGNPREKQGAAGNPTRRGGSHEP